MLIIAMIIMIIAIALFFGSVGVQAQNETNDYEQVESTQEVQQDLALVNMRIMNTMNFNYDLFLEAVDNDFIFFVGHIGTGNRDLIATSIDIIQFDYELRKFSSIIF